jgi:hypothetical protein
VRKWVASLSGDDEGFLAVVIGLLGVSTSTGVRNGKTYETRRYYISRKSAEQVFTLDESLRQRIAKIDRGPLREMQKHALEELLRNIEQKAKGVIEADFGLPD